MFVRINLFKLFTVFILVLSACSKSVDTATFTLSNWEFREANSEWLPAEVPGFVHLDLFNNNLIEDPFYRANELESSWVAEKVWEYRSAFILKEDFLLKQSIKLNFAGIDTYAEVFLND